VIEGSRRRAGPGPRGREGERETAERVGERTLLLGRDHSAPGVVEVGVQRAGDTAFALSAGRSKGAPEEVNEDALLVLDEGPRTLLAVCDAHWGPEASHELLQRLDQRLPLVPRDSEALRAALAALVSSRSAPPTASETTLLIAVWDRASARGFGLSFGDSSLLLVGGDGPPQRVNRKTPTYVGPWERSSLDPRRAHQFAFRAQPGALVVAFTDGIDECHYRRPDTSVRPEHLQDLLVASEGDPERFVRRLTELALGGVDGHPGGEDHLALVVTRA
jgi:hypothetical protein